MSPREPHHQPPPLPTCELPLTGFCVAHINTYNLIHRPNINPYDQFYNAPQTLVSYLVSPKADNTPKSLRQIVLSNTVTLGGWAMVHAADRVSRRS